MIRHICLFKFKEYAEGRTKAENIEITRSMLEALPQTIEYIKSSKVCIGAEDQVEDNYDLILISDFESFETLEKYKVHPDHVAVGNFMRPVRTSRVCIDYQV